MRALWLLVLLAPACATSELDTDEQHASALAGDPIGFVDGGLWYRKVGCPSPDPSTCVHEAMFWVDLKIRNDAYDKRVGIVWIDRVRHDSSAPWRLATASYEGTRGDGYETWGVDVSAGAIGGNEPRPQIQLAAFVEMIGATSWDNNGGADHVIE